MKRPGTVWIFSVLATLGIMRNTLPVFFTLYMTRGLNYLSIIQILLLIPEVIFVYKFFTLKKNSITWLYISFGISILLELMAKSWIGAVITAAFGWAVWDYITHKKIDGQNVFQ